MPFTCLSMKAIAIGSGCSSVTQVARSSQEPMAAARSVASMYSFSRAWPWQVLHAVFYHHLAFCCMHCALQGAQAAQEAISTLHSVNIGSEAGLYVSKAFGRKPSATPTCRRLEVSPGQHPEGNCLLMARMRAPHPAVRDSTAPRGRC